MIRSRLRSVTGLQIREQYLRIPMRAYRGYWFNDDAVFVDKRRLKRVKRRGKMTAEAVRIVGDVYRKYLPQLIDTLR